ncbi:hypothetical protein PILCRDRAFT_644150 [Piloderma croceum F 1598]|uniref:Uncharacterized protein n=1 Tax=Piloderma croceum (strain F 1598) TaxID=765440 RepID=A0A0C3F9Q2_PILCF|nr:hypothetical protein PILCRDRAFT_644150 [Piloderma croceum F 1598]
MPRCSWHSCRYPNSAASFGHHINNLHVKIRKLTNAHTIPAETSMIVVKCFESFNSTLINNEHFSPESEPYEFKPDDIFGLISSAKTTRRLHITRGSSVGGGTRRLTMQPQGLGGTGGGSVRED